MTRTMIEVTRDARGWRIERDGESVISLEALADAMEQAGQLARDNSPSVLVVHGADGAVTDRTPYELEIATADAA